MDFVVSDILWQVYNSTKTKQNRSFVTTVSSTHADASSELWCHRHLRTLRSGSDQAHRLPGAPVPRPRKREYGTRQVVSHVVHSIAYQLQLL